MGIEIGFEFGLKSNCNLKVNVCLMLGAKLSFISKSNSEFDFNVPAGAQQQIIPARERHHPTHQDTRNPLVMVASRIFEFDQICL